MIERILAFFGFRKKKAPPPKRKDFKAYVASLGIDKLRGPARGKAMRQAVQNRKMFE